MIELLLLAKSFQELNYNWHHAVDSISIPDEKDVLDSNPAEYAKSSFVSPERIWKDAKAVMEANQFYALSIVGPQGSGKTTLAAEFTKFAKEDEFRIVYALPEDFMRDMQAWLDKVIKEPRVKNCLVIDDLSYSIDAQPRKQQAVIKNLVSRFRHIFGGQLFVVYVTHRLHGAPPMLRNSGTWVFSAMQAADREDAGEVIGKTKEMRDRLQALYNFIARVSIDGPKNKIIKFFFKDKEVVFKWGTEKEHGDGRLMACFHSGKLDIFCSNVSDMPINLEDFRYKD